MLTILRDEGFNVSDREVANIRKKEKLFMREPHAALPKSSEVQIEGSGGQPNQNDNQAFNTTPVAGQKRPSTSQDDPPLPLEVIVKRQARHTKLLAESAERLRYGTRRRRTKPWLGVPPDTGLPPRFPSELTLTESKELLGLDNEMYRKLRETFTEICRAHNVIKKTISGPEMWTFSKGELISQMPHLQAIFRGPGSDQLSPTREPMALDLICIDVTKKIRTVDNYIPLQDAKNHLGLTPQESREVRGGLDTILRADFFTSKKDVTKEHWEALKAKWIKESPRLQRELAGAEEDPDWNEKLRSVEYIARDVQKRHRDSQTRKDPARKQSMAEASKRAQAKAKATKAAELAGNENNPSTLPVNLQPPPQVHAQPSPAPKRPGPSSQNKQPKPTNLTYDPAEPWKLNPYKTMQIDPTLLSPASHPHRSPHQQLLAAAQNQTQPSPQQPPPASPPHPTAVFFRLTPLSARTYPTAPKLWLDTLHPPYSLSNLRELVMRKEGLEGRVGKIEGLADPGTGAGAGGEGTRWAIDQDDEVEAFLEFVGAKG